jgi:RNA polymerase sigma factor (sigma-70 family)
VTGAAMQTTFATARTRDTDDSMLVARCLAGDDASWQQLVLRYTRLVEALIRRYHLPADDQADVFQDVWVELWQNLSSVRSQDRLGPWLSTVAGRLAWDARKRLPRQIAGEPAALLLAGIIDDADGPEQQVMQRDATERLRIGLAHVSPRCRLLLEALFFDESPSYLELAAQLDCSPNSIGPIRGRCFKELRTALQNAHTWDSTCRGCQG